MTGRLSGMLLMSAAVLGGLLAAEWRYGVVNDAPIAVEAVPGVQPDADPGGLENPVPPIDTLAATVERPLFSPARRPPEPAAEPTPPAPERPQTRRHKFVVSAVVIDAGHRFALVRDPRDGTVRRLSEGESLAGWTLVEVHADRVLMAHGDERQSIDLRTFQAPAPVPAPAVKATPEQEAASEPETAGAEDADLRRPRRPKRGPRADAGQ